MFLYDPRTLDEDGKVGRNLPKVLTPNEQAALLQQFNTRYWSPHRNLVLIRFALATGLRAGELIAVRDKHLEFDTAGGRVMVRDGKGAKDRAVYFSPEIRNALDVWLQPRAQETESNFLFPTRKGTQMLTSYLRQFVKREARKAGIKEAEKVSPHTLRHTAAVDLLRETERLEIVQEFLGHSDISTTRIYARLVNGEVEEACRNFRSGSPPGEDDGSPEEGSLERLLRNADPEQVVFAQKVLEAAGIG